MPSPTLTEELRIDGIQADLVPIGGPTGRLVVSADGTIAVVQRQDATIKFFGPDGALRSIFGGSGEGPGEFRSIQRIGWRGDTLWAFDGSLRRTTLVSPGKGFVRTVPFPVLAKPGPEGPKETPTFLELYPGAFSALDLHLVSLLTPTAVDPVDSFIGKQGVGYVSAEGRLSKVLFYRPIGPIQINAPEGTATLPFPNPYLISFSAKGTLIAGLESNLEGPEKGTLSVTLWDSDGEVLFTVSHPFDPVPIPQSVADSVWNRRTRPLSPSLLRAYEARATVPPMYPPVSGLLVGRDGTIWIEGRGTPDGREYLILSPKGDVAGSLFLPDKGRIAAAETERIWVIEFDHLDVESIVRYGLSWR